MKLPLSENLIEDDKYQVLVCSSPANIIVGFAAHTWFVVNRKGTIARWEMLFDKKDREQSVGYLNKDYFDPFTGIEVLPGWRKYMWKGSVRGVVSGGEDSAAGKMINVIENSFKAYPFVEKYSLLSANSNTYTQWVLDQFPDVDIELPWNAIGKKFKY